MKILFVMALVSLASAHVMSPDYKICIKDSHVVVNDIFHLVEILEDNHVNPPAGPFKELLHSVNILLAECFQIDIHLERYDHCVDDLLVVFPTINKLIDDINNNRQTDIILDVSTLALQLTNGITQCLKIRPALAF